MKFLKLISALMAVFLPVAALADVKMPSIFSDNMMLQQATSVKIFGKADAGEKITVKASWGAENSATAAADGKWELYLDTPAASSVPQSLEIKGESCTERIENVLIGEVWLCTGQSNMEFPVCRQGDGSWATGMLGEEAELADSDYPEIRLFQVSHQLAPDGGKDDVEGKWTVCNAGDLYDFSAVAYVFGKRLHKELGVPVGLVQDTWGGTPIEAWTKMDVMDGNPCYTDVLNMYARDKMEKEGWTWLIPSTLWNGMIAPIAGFTVKGNIWYQGESNVYVGKYYRQTLINLISSWRNEWNQLDMPFYFAQLAPYSRDPFPSIRDSQLQVWRKSGLRNVGMVATADVGDSIDIHPRNKKAVGERFARWALAKQYGRDVAYSGPVFKSLSQEGVRLVLEFDYAEGGLSTSDGEPVKAFEVAGSDKVFRPAVAEIKGGRIEVYSPDVADPVAVRYAWKNYCRVNLVNSDGLPAVPFRSDNWEL